MQISVLMPTLRRDPQFQMMADSLAHCIEVLRRACGKLEVEWVIVDGRLWYDDELARRQLVAEVVRGRFPVQHVKPKPSVWQGPTRLTQKDHWDKASASNTGICYARGQQIVFTDDCQIFEEGWLLAHHMAGQAGIAAAGGYKYVYAGTGTVVDGRLIGGKFEHEWRKIGDEFVRLEVQAGDHRLVERTYPEPCPGGWMYGGNGSAPLEACLKIDGFDEIMSGQGGLEDCDFGVRVERVVPLWFLPHANVIQIMDTHETVGEFLSGSAERCGAEPPKVTKKCKGYPYLDDKGIVHHMSDNHRPILRLVGARPAPRGDGYYRHEGAVALQGELKRFTAIGNHWLDKYGRRMTLRALRHHVQSGGAFPIPTYPDRDWRDGQPLKEMD